MLGSVSFDVPLSCEIQAVLSSYNDVAVFEIGERPLESRMC